MGFGYITKGGLDGEKIAEWGGNSPVTEGFNSAQMTLAQLVGRLGLDAFRTVTIPGHGVGVYDDLGNVYGVGAPKQQRQFDPVTGWELPEDPSVPNDGTWRVQLTKEAMDRLGDASKARLDAKKQESDNIKMLADVRSKGWDVQNGKLVRAPEMATVKPAKPTEGNYTSSEYAMRMIDSDKKLAELAGKVSPAAINAKVAAENIPLIGGLAGWIGNEALSDNNQMAEQAMRNFLNAKLRKESGATISPAEFDNARKQYFPQPGDGPDVIRQKAINRRLAIKGLMLGSGPLQDQVLQAVGGYDDSGNVTVRPPLSDFEE